MELSVKVFFREKLPHCPLISSVDFGCIYEVEHVLQGKRVAIKEFFVKDFCNRDSFI